MNKELEPPVFARQKFVQSYIIADPGRPGVYNILTWTLLLCKSGSMLLRLDPKDLYQVLLGVYLCQRWIVESFQAIHLSPGQTVPKLSAPKKHIPKATRKTATTKQQRDKQYWDKQHLYKRQLDKQSLDKHQPNKHCPNKYCPIKQHKE